MGVDLRSATGPHSQCNCVTPFVDILREGLRVTALCGLA